MKWFLIALFSLGFFLSHAQKINPYQNPAFPKRLAPTNAFHFVTPNFVPPNFKSRNFNRLAYQSSQVNKSIEKRWQPAEYDPFRLFNGLDSKSAMVTVSTLQGHCGNIKISCDYMYDETGRLVDAISSWDFGR